MKRYYFPRQCWSLSRVLVGMVLLFALSTGSAQPPSGKMTLQGSDDPLLLINHTGTTGNPAIWFQQDEANKAFLWWDQVNSRLNLGTPVVNPIVSLQDNGSRLEIFAQDGLAITGFQPFLTLRDTNPPAAGARSILAGGNGDFGFYPNSFIGGFPAVIIKNGTGNVGIGTPSPGARLDIAGTTRTGVLQITGGSDIAEPFEIIGAEAVKLGMVVAIDPERSGLLRIADKAYDRTVAGIVSGANKLNPGLTLKQEGTEADGSLPVSLTGRVYCWADASYGPIEPGDLLTSSDIPGHAMKVTDYVRAQGAIIGKAMSSLTTGRGLVLALVTLQ